MSDSGDAMVAFLGVPADPSLLSEDLDGLSEAAVRPESVVVTDTHDRLVAAGSLMTAVTLIGGIALALFGAEQLIAGGGGALAVVLIVVGLVLAGTHWGWVHVAEYVGLGRDEHQERANREREAAWLATVAPYARFTIRTTVMADASIAVERVMYRPALTSGHTFTFDRVAEARATFDPDTPAHVIADRVETLRREARLETDRQGELWDAARTAYDAALIDADDEQQQLAARRAGALALSQHINASLLQPPLIE
jgi:hypothetical protein